MRVRVPMRGTGAEQPVGPGFSASLARSAIPEDYRPISADDPPRTAHSQLDRDGAQTAYRRIRQNPPEMPLLQYTDPQTAHNSSLLTQ